MGGSDPASTGASAELLVTGNVDDVLAHFGVKGMKWGTRKASSVSSTGDSDHHSEDSKNAVDAKAKVSAGGTKTLSNKELQDLVKRMQLEQQYSDLTGKHNTSSSKHKAAGKFVGDFMLNFGKQEAGKILSAILAKQLKNRIPGLK